MISPNTQLVVNADDLGISSGFDEGIFKAHNNGIVTSASTFVNFPYLTDTLENLKKYPELDVGLHLNLTWGDSLSGGASLGKNGKFFGKIKKLMINSWLRKLNYEEVYEEVKQQMSRFSDCGFHCAHLDTHQHILLIPEVIRSVKELSPHFGFNWIRIPIENYYPGFIKINLLNSYSRIINAFYSQKSAHRVYGILSAGELTTNYLKNLILNLKPGFCELICHPGIYKEEDLISNKYDRLKKIRETELNSLCSEEIKSLIAERGIQLNSWSNLNKE